MSESNPNALPPESTPTPTTEGETDTGVTRRRFLTAVNFVVGGVGALVLGVPLTGFVMAPLLEPEERAWRDVGDVNTFPIGSTTKVIFEDPSPLPWSGITARMAAWLRRESETEFIAFTVNCAHLGCPVRWLEEANLFMCPCHGGAYYRNGEVAAGPPPAPLPRFATRVQNGRVEIQSSGVPIMTASRRNGRRLV